MDDIVVSGPTNRAEKNEINSLMMVLNGVCQFCWGGGVGYGEQSPERALSM
jgi:hypothetical protein